MLENIADKIARGNSEWQGTPTELVDFLGVDIKANALTMKLNIIAVRLIGNKSNRIKSRTALKLQSETFYIVIAEVNFLS